jgi:AbrB family looped-hinge helix DNA binding protein
MEISKVSAKGQVTLPKKIRESLGLHPGDLISYDVDDGIVSIRRLESFDAPFHSALSGTLEEWNTPEDDEAFRDL